MKFTTDKVPGNFIRFYQPGEIHLRNQILTSHAIIGADSLITDWQPAEIDVLSIADFQAALDQKPEILLFGTGTTQQFPDIRLLTEIMQAGTAIEVMQTEAACRTFNVLIGENRSVIAALLIN